MEIYLIEILIFGLGFVLIALVAKDVGRLFSKLKLPKITGYLFTGIVAGPFVLGLISAEAVERPFIDDEGYNETGSIAIELGVCRGDANVCVAIVEIVLPQQLLIETQAILIVSSTALDPIEPRRLARRDDVP